MSKFKADLEKDYLHRAVACLINARFDDWDYEARVGGKYRVDFLVRGEQSVHLIECKMSLKPQRDIEQINFYFELFGDPRARKFIATDASAPYPQDVLNQYTAHNITVWRVNVDQSHKGYYTVMHMFPDHCYENKMVDAETRQKIRAAYIPKKTSVRALSCMFGVPPGVVTHILKTADYIPYREVFKTEETSL